MEAGTGPGFEIFGLTFAQFKCFVDGSQSFAHRMGRCKRSEIQGIVKTYFSYDRKIGIFFFQINPQRRIAFIIF